MMRTGLVGAHSPTAAPAHGAVANDAAAAETKSVLAIAEWRMSVNPSCFVEAAVVSARVVHRAVRETHVRVGRVLQFSGQHAFLVSIAAPEAVERGRRPAAWPPAHHGYYSGLAPEALITFAHFTVSLLM
jgi:hypothetical protein